jgi:hypothetical protein
MLDPDTIRLTYRQLGERLGIKPHAARMKASRAVAKGRWRIVPGNHPNDSVTVELPAADLLQRDPHVTLRTVLPARDTAHTPTQDPAQVEALAIAHARIAQLTDRLLVEVEARQQDRESVAAGEARELMLEGEIIRLGDDVTTLTQALDRARRPWWRR